jgi:alpha-ketoglutarate-dependent taurine dioxygenase
MPDSPTPSSAKSSTTFSTRRNDAGDGLPVASGAGGLPGLLEFVDHHRSWLDDQLRTRGAALLRGFGLRTPAEFEEAAHAVEPVLQNEYLGTSPRDALTPYVFSASELPPYYPIPQHCEMTFIKRPPRRLMFACLVAPTGGGGETPVCDMRTVAAGLAPAVRDRFERGGIRIIRNYGGPSGKGRFDLWQLKRWDEIFQTTDRAAVEARCAEEGVFTDLHWGPGDRLRLISEHDALRAHPETGVPVWFNHVQVFHLSTAPAELRRIYRRTGDLRSLGLWGFARAAVAAKRRFTPPEAQSLHCTHRDGREIDPDDLEHVRDTIWKHMIAEPWQQGDMLVIDNFAVSHGRLPYRGPRQVVVAWA